MLGKLLDNLYASVSILIDKFVAVIACPDEQVKEECIQNIQRIADSLEQRHDLKFKLLKSQGGYRYSIKLPLIKSIPWSGALHGVPHLYVQVAPFGKKRPFIKFELKGFSPTKRQYYAASLWLHKIIGSHAERILHASNIKITALDIAMDFPLDIAQVAVNLMHAHTSGVYLDIDSSGRIGTIYIGTKKSKIRIVIYDRLANCKAKGLAHSGLPCTRIEMQVKPNCSLDMLSSELLKSHFLERIEVYDLNEIKALEGLHPHTLSVIKTLGLKAAFQSLPKPERRRYRKAFESCRVDLIPNEKVYRELEKKLKRTAALVLGRNDSAFNHSAAKKVRKHFKDNYS